MSSALSPVTLAACRNAVNGAPAAAYNFTASQYTRTRGAISAVRAGKRRMRVGILSDSTGFGTGSTTGASGLAGAQANCWPTQLGGVLNAVGIPSGCNSANGQGSVGGGLVSYPSMDTRVVLGAGWSASGSSSLGGFCYYFPNGGGVAPLAFTPPQAFDNFRVWYISGGGNGSVAVNVDGGASLGTINTSGGGTIASTAFTTTNGTHVINLVPTNTQLNIIGIEAWSSVTPRVEILNFSNSGFKVSNFLSAANAWDKFNAIAAYAATDPIDLWIIGLDINDSNSLTNTATYQANYQSLITKCKATGAAGNADIIMIGGFPSAGYEANRATYVGIEKQLATANGCTFIDQLVPIPTVASGTANGFYYTDYIHGSTLGYGQTADLVARVLLAV